MFLSIKEMELREVRFDETYEPGQIDFSDVEVQQSGPLHVTGVGELLANTEGEVRIKGHLDVRLECTCDRCLSRARLPLEEPFDLFYRPVATIAREEEVEIDEGEAQIGFYEGGGMQLEDVLREQILLMLPMQRICKEDCRGICPVCGRNRNETQCDCKVETHDDRWEALRKY